MRRFVLIFLLLSGFVLQAEEQGVFRFWWNMGNVRDGYVNGVADRENFLPILLNIRPFVQAWAVAGVMFRLRGNGMVNVALTDISRNDVWALYRSDDVLAGGVFNQPFDSAGVLQLTNEGWMIPPNVINRIRQGCDVVLACEIRPEARNGIILFEAVLNGKVLFSFPISIMASRVEDMYHWINLRHVSGQSESVPTMTYLPSNADWSEDLPHVFFVHGANVDEAASRVWCEKMFKRLYLSGAKMRFHGVSWRSQVAGSSDYHLNASNSFDVASSLATSVNAFSGRKVVIAHSLGTMLTANAIQFFGMQVDKVIFLNSAIPSESIDESRFSVQSTNLLVHDDWREYPTNCWTALYHTLDSGGTDRARLTWRNRYPLVAPKLFNMYSSGDEVLDLFDGDGNPGWTEGAWSSSSLGARFSWQKQELWKGRAAWYAGIGTTRWSGWGFRTRLFGLRAWSAEEANAVTDPTVFATNTVFNPYPMTIMNAVLTEAEINAHLTQGIPALSPALGSVSVADVAESFDMNTDGDQQRPNGWPNNYDDFGTAWLHSDIKDVPYFYTFPKFDLIVLKGGLK